MKKLFLKLYERLYSGFVPVSGTEKGKVIEWLKNSEEHEGYKGYLTGRKKILTDMLSYEMDGKEYWKTIGRLEEVRLLGQKIKESVKINEKRYGQEKGNGED